MNQAIRKFLIDQSVKGTPVYYEVIAKKLNLDLENPAHRDQLTIVLRDIAVYEHEHDRPLVTAIAIYKQKNDHGYGFYKLCETLGIGKASDLNASLYGFTQLEESKKFWGDADNYKAHYSIQEEETIHDIEFFTADEIDFLAEWAGKTYYKYNPTHIAAKEYIKNSLGSKTKYWSNEVVRRIPSLDTYNPRVWSQKGWDETEEGKVRVAKFKDYTWARIYRLGDDYKDIFFTVGVQSNPKELVYKLHYYFEKTSVLSASQKALLEREIPSELRWKSIPADDLKKHDWDSLINITTDFINNNLNVYDQLMQAVWGETEPDSSEVNTLRPQETPDTGISALPAYRPNFEGVEVNHLQKAVERKERGDAGEALVLQYEKKKLLKAGLDKLAHQVKKVQDGKGYDVLSFHPDGSLKYIEVKTTTGGAVKPFHMTRNERCFAQLNPQEYYIYRLYNYDEINHSADFYIIDQIEEKLLFQETDYNAYLKKTKK